MATKRTHHTETSRGRAKKRRVVIDLTADVIDLTDDAPALDLNITPSNMMRCFVASTDGTLNERWLQSLIAAVCEHQFTEQIKIGICITPMWLFAYALRMFSDPKMQVKTDATALACIVLAIKILDDHCSDEVSSYIDLMPHQKKNNTQKRDVLRVAETQVLKTLNYCTHYTIGEVYHNLCAQANKAGVSLER